MADGAVAITAGTGTPIRVLTGLGSASADQQVMTLADSAGNLLGAPGAPFPVSAVTDAATSGTMAATSAAVAIATGGRAVTAIELTGTWAGTVSFQGTSDPAGIAAATASWYAVNAPSPTASGLTSTTTVNGLFRINSGGYTAVRAIMTAYTSGTATVWVNSSAMASLATLAEPVTIGAALPAGGNTIGTVVSTPVVPATATNTVAVAAAPGATGTIGHAAATITAAVTTAAAFINAPAAGLSIYITDINVTNSGATATLVSLFTAGQTVPLAAKYAPATTSAPASTYRTPIRVGTATALNYTNSAASTSVFVQVTYYIAA